MRTIFTFIIILIIIRVTHIDDLVWPAIQHGFSFVNSLVQKVN